MCVSGTDKGEKSNKNKYKTDSKTARCSQGKKWRGKWVTVGRKTCLYLSFIFYYNLFCLFVCVCEKIWRFHSRKQQPSATIGIIALLFKEFFAPKQCCQLA